MDPLTEIYGTMQMPESLFREALSTLNTAVGNFFPLLYVSKQFEFELETEIFKIFDLPTKRKSIPHKENDCTAATAMCSVCKGKDTWITNIMLA